MDKMKKTKHSNRTGAQRKDFRPVNKPISTTPTDWNNSALWYDDLVGERGHFHHERTIIPGLKRILKLNAGQHLLDVACGQGVVCRAFAQMGVRVTGVDMAPELIHLAKQRSQSEELEDYYEGDARQLADFIKPPPHGFDAACCVLAIANMTPLSPVWRSIGALLKPRGTLVVVMLHPCFRIPRASDWYFDAVALKQARAVSQYLTSANISIEMHPGNPASELTHTFHRPLQAYFNTLSSAGFLVEHMEEWTSEKRPPKGVRYDAMERARKEIPMFLALKARYFAADND